MEKVEKGEPSLVDIYWVPQKYAQTCTVIHVHLYWEGCVIICGRTLGTYFVQEILIPFYVF